MTKVLWTQKQDVGPSGRGGHAIAYDPARERVLLFGGRAGGGTLQGDTWEWDGGDWTQVADTGPDARSGHALAFDSNRQRMVLFGSEAAGALRADTWEWDGADWTQLADTGPDARSGHALAYDSNRQRTVLFGGEAAGSSLRADTWEWDGADWTQVADTGPDARSRHALAYDSNRQRTVLFGGEAPPDLRADTWGWDGAEWTQVADMGPGPSHYPAMTFGAGLTLLFGGVTSPPPPVAAEALSRLSWEWDGEHWTLRQDMGPAPRWGHALAFDSARGRAVLFGGFSALPADPEVADSILGDTWEASLEEIPVEPPAVALVSFVLNPDTVIGGGSAGGGGDVSFEVGLDGPAPPGGVQVDIFFEQNLVLSVFVAEGQGSGSQTLPMPAGQPLGDYPLEAKLGEVSLTAVLHVVPGAAPVSLASFAINPDTIALTVPPGTAISFEVGLDGPAPPGGVTVAILGPASVDPVIVLEGSSTGSQTLAWDPVLLPGPATYQFAAQLGAASLAADLHVVPG
jgi:Galactose oxidase, central domain